MGHVAILVSCVGADSNPPTREVIQGLIDSLGSRYIMERDEAGNKLLGLGIVAVPQLREAAGSDDPEIALRAQHLVRELGVTRTAVVRTVAYLLEMALMALYEGQYSQCQKWCEFIGLLDPDYGFPNELRRLMRDDRFKAGSAQHAWNGELFEA